MKKLSTGIRLSLAGAAVTALFAGVVAPAYAATNTTVAKVGSTLEVIGAFSTANSIVVSPDTGIIRVKDNNANVSALAGCVSQGQHEVKCPTAGISQIRVSTGARDDIVTLKTGLFTTVLGGDGNDTLQNLGSGQARLNGNNGDDRLFGGIVDSLFGQNDQDFLKGGQLLRGGPGDDTLQGLDGNDSMFGDDGFDNLDGGPGFDDLCDTAEITVNCEA